MRTITALLLSSIVAKHAGAQMVCPRKMDTPWTAWTADIPDKDLMAPHYVRDCPHGGMQETTDCADGPSLKAQWSEWSDWTKAVYQASGGTYVTRSRACDSPFPDKACGAVKCKGKASQTRTCTSPDAPVRAGGWSDWADWVRFETPRGSSGMTRTRTCTSPPPDCGGEYCRGTDYQTRPCTDCA